ncbi:hypothetical protein C5F49_05140 [Nitrosopumilus oxyclinae]|uniref:Uncharacterized protein n=1 Tax=Nitrosopumilus oxyclinae TaxID=1959104 RepID=A0A7D5M1J1_9ARCH|nr:hypothetical protein [Nitrosopumilus oxyclinae]QLH04766.1 hypothetical protein C5F49_05140 [Nitrosopumilus oxyclinae]
MSQSEPAPKKYERERILLESIKNNPDLHHNALLKILVPEFMAKTTFEKIRDSLIKKEIISVRIKGNMKFYYPSEDYEINLQHQVERNTNTYFHDLKLEIKKLDVDYPHKDIDEKILVANSILRNLIRTDTGFTILDSSKNPKKTLYRDEHLEIQQLIHHIFKIIRNDRHFDIIFPTIVSNLGFFIPQSSWDEDLV